MKYEGKDTTVGIIQQRVLQQVVSTMKTTRFVKSPSTNEKSILDQFHIDVAINVKQIKIIRWLCPKVGFSLNVDGAAKGNPGHCGGGGCLRGSNGELVHGFSYYYGIGTSLMAETRALLDGLRMGEKSGLPITVIYSDSMTLCSLIQSNKHPPWRICYWWEEIKAIIDRNQWSLQHTYREGNCVADTLASLACSTCTN